MTLTFIKNWKLKITTGFNILLTLASKTLTALTIMIIIIIFARSFGPEGIGILTLIVLISGVAFIFGNLGIDNANVYYLSSKKDSIKQTFYNTLIQSLALSLLMIIIFLLFFALNHNIVGSLKFIYFALALGYIPFVFLERLLQSIFIGKQDFKSFSFPLIYSKLFTLSSIIVSIYIFKTNLFLTVLIFLIANMILPIWYLAILIKENGLKMSFDKNIFKKNFYFGIKAYLIATMCFLVLRSDLYILNIFHGLKEVGFYSVATNFFDGINLITVSLALVLFPKMSQDSKQSYKVLFYGLKLSLILIVPIVLFIAFISKPLIIFLFGGAFLPAIIPFFILAIALIFWSMTIIINQYFASQGIPNYLILLWFFGFLLNLFLNILYIPKFGMMAAAISSLLTYFLLWIITFVLAKRLNKT